MKGCPMDCNGRGACNTFSGVCLCYAGWGGDDCKGRPAEKLWAYNAGNGQVDPSQWGSLTPAYKTCAAGNYQSPVNLPKDGVTPFFHKVEFEYNSSEISYTLVNNGRFLTLIHPPGNSMTVGTHRYELKNVTLHSPSEHAIGKERFALELQLHHADDYGNMASVALLFKSVSTISGHFYKRIAATNFWDVFAPIHSNSHRNMTVLVDFNPFLPRGKEESHFHAYPGSYTHPPCIEGVQWLVMAQKQEVLTRDVSRLMELIGENSRPIQPALGRRFHFF